jgi:AbrB family looped-hinge helix DNA binding protein
METVTLSSKGQIEIPKEIRESRNLNAGTEFIVSFSGDEIRLLPIPVFPPTKVEDGLGALAKPGRKRLGEREMECAIAEMLLREDEASKS